MWNAKYNRVNFVNNDAFASLTVRNKATESPVFPFHFPLNDSTRFQMKIEQIVEEKMSM